MYGYGNRKDGSFMIIALAQMKMDSSMKSNYRKSVQMIMEAANRGADIVCFPEVQLTPFFPQYQNINATPFVSRLDDAYVSGICAACQKNNIHAAVNFYLHENGKYYDMSLLIDDNGNLIGKQKMVHVAQCEHFYEQDYYTPSEEGFHVFETKYGKIGIVVCFDRHYPESIRTEVIRGADLVIIPTANTSDEPSELFQWEIKVQAFQNSVNIAMCNRCGTEDHMNFSGESIVVDYQGDTKVIGGHDESLLIADVNLAEASIARSQKPYIHLRRSGLYE